MRYVLADINVVYLSLQCSFRDCDSGVDTQTLHMLHSTVFSLSPSGVSLCPSLCLSVSLSFFVLVACPGAVRGKWSSGLCSASARHNRTHRSSCCLWPSTFAFAVCVTVLERTTIALRSSRCTTSQCTLDSPRITYIIICNPRVRTTEGGDHVRMTGHVRAGMGHRELVSD